jgi:hypothetical protein
MPTVGFEPLIPASERLQTPTSDRTDTRLDFHPMRTVYTVNIGLATKCCGEIL